MRGWTLGTREEKLRYLEKLVGELRAPHDPAWKSIEDQRGPPHFAMLCAAPWAIPFLLEELKGEFARGQEETLKEIGTLEGSQETLNPQA